MLRRSTDRRSGVGGGRRGFVMFAALVLLIFLFALVLYLVNNAAIVAEKVHAQDAADAVAASAAVWEARGLNAVSSANVLMGEGIALAAVHTAIAGRDVDGRDLSAADQRRNQRAVSQLHAWAPGARGAGGWTLTYRDAVQPLRAAMTVGQAKINLKERLVMIYRIQATLGHLPWVGRAIVAAMNALEALVYLEWRVLDALESYARATLSMQRLAFEQLAPAARRFAEAARRTVPALTVATARELSRRRGLTVALDPPRPELPVVPETSRAGDDDHERAMARAQSTRCAWPFVRYDRGPVLTTTTPLVLSGARGLFLRWTQSQTTARAQEFERRYGPLFVLVDSAPDLKGKEPWTTDPRAADRRFARLAFVRSPARRAIGAPAFSDPVADGVVAYAQSIAYNANPQRPDAAPPAFQREVGWDLLPWRAPITSSGAYEFPNGPASPGPYPGLHLNWQAMLVPVTSRLDASPAVLPPEFARPIARVVPVAPTLRTH